MFFFSLFFFFFVRLPSSSSFPYLLMLFAGVDDGDEDMI